MSSPLFKRTGNNIIMIRNDQTRRDWSGHCELCGKFAELRPYGPNNEMICFECGYSDLETTEQKFHEMYNQAGN